MLIRVAINQRYRDFVAETASEADATSAVVCYTLKLSTPPSPSGYDNVSRTQPQFPQCGYSLESRDFLASAISALNVVWG